MKKYYSQSFVALFLSLSLFANATHAGKDDSSPPSPKTALYVIVLAAQAIRTVFPELFELPTPAAAPRPAPQVQQQRIELVLPGENPDEPFVVSVTPEEFQNLREHASAPALQAAGGNARIELPAGITRQGLAIVLELIRRLAKIERRLTDDNSQEHLRIINQLMIPDIAKLSQDQILDLLNCIDLLKIDRLQKAALLAFIKGFLTTLFAQNPQDAVAYLAHIHTTMPRVARNLLTYLPLITDGLPIGHLLAIIPRIERNVLAHGVVFHEALLQMVITSYTERHVIPTALKNPNRARAMLRELARPDSPLLLHFAFGIIQTTSFENRSEVERHNIARIIRYIDKTARRSRDIERSSLPGKIEGAIVRVLGESVLSAFHRVRPQPLEEKQHANSSSAGSAAGPAMPQLLSSVLGLPGIHALRDPTIAPQPAAAAAAAQPQAQAQPSRAQSATSEAEKEKLAKKMAEFKERLKALKKRIDAALTTSDDSVIKAMQNLLRVLQKEIAATQERVGKQKINMETIDGLLYELESWETSAESLMRKIIRHEQSRIESIAMAESRGAGSGGAGAAAAAPAARTSPLLSALGQMISASVGRPLSPRTVIGLSDVEGSGVRITDPTQAGFERDGRLRTALMARGFAADGAHQLKSNADETYFNEGRTMILSRDRDEHAGEATFKLFVKVGSNWVYRDTVTLIVINEKVYIRRLDRSKSLAKSQPKFYFLMDSSGKWYVVEKEGDKNEIREIPVIKEK